MGGIAIPFRNCEFCVSVAKSACLGIADLQFSAVTEDGLFREALIKLREDPEDTLRPVQREWS